jgi:Arc/MetJ family transcription regulator
MAGPWQDGWIRWTVPALHAASTCGRRETVHAALPARVGSMLAACCLAGLEKSGLDRPDARRVLYGPLRA